MSFDVLWLSASDIDTLGISMSEIMDEVEQGFSAMGEGLGEMPAKIGVHPRKDCFIHAMPCHIGGDIDVSGVKVVSGYPPNQKKGLPYITGIFCLLDPETGVPIAVIDAGWITAWRTGAASGVYARHFGDPSTTSVAIIGLGVQGRVNLLAMKEVFPKLETVRMFDPFPAQVERFQKDMQPQLPGVQFVNCADVRKCVTGSDVIVTCSPILEKPQRFVSREWLKDDVLCISVDYDSAFQATCMAENFTCDNFNQYTWTKEQGSYFQNGYPHPDQIYADMGEICCKKKQGVRSGLRGAVLMGIASHDVMTGALIFKKATVAKAGTTVQL